MLLLLLPALAFAGQVDLKGAKITRHNMSRVAHALEQYQAVCNEYPATEAGLDVLSKPVRCGKHKHSTLLKAVKKDAWGRPFNYESDGKTYKLTSFGADGKEGGAGLDMDIVLTR